MKTTLNYLTGLVALVSSVCLAAPAFENYYQIERLDLPQDVPPEVGAVQFDSEGKLYVALRRGDIITAIPGEQSDQFQWKLFATGFHNPCGMEVVAPGHIVVSQMPELTDVKDTDGDGVADSYRSLTSEWGVSGNYHETNEICPDGEGGYYIAVGTASHNGPTFEYLRGDYSKIGRRGRNFSSVKWKGWVLHYKKDGSVEPFAKGFRMHNGIMRDKDGNIWCGDNQGDWRATTPIYHVEKDQFYGHPSSLVWDPNWPEGKDPLKMSLKEINAMRTRAAVLVPYKEFNRSASEPIQIPEGYGPFAGQILVLDNNGQRITRLMLEKVDGKFQGACTHFIDSKQLLSGGNRAVFSPDGKYLYTGHTVRGWSRPAEGLMRISLKEKIPFDVKMMRLTKEGFELEFTQDLKADTAALADFKVHSYRDEPKWSYGGPKMGQRKEAAVSMKMTAGNKLKLDISGLEPGRVYQLDLAEGADLESQSGQKLLNRSYCYTLNSLIP
ncbi:hypothetical protein Rhal01_02271 [Rubritalea halochordaticola]|uniref:DUF7133 domain-containing protein n=1 Tax=Rubritalea halochordaticola TaxID=714537 RepID=A0ABP9V266_9BACT